MAVITARNTRLAVAAKDKPLTADFVSDIIEFREMTIGSIQVVRIGGDANDGTFSLEISDICDPDSFAPYPFSEIAGCNDRNIMWLFKEIPFMFARVLYAKGTDTVGTASVYAIGKK